MRSLSVLTIALFVAVALSFAGLAVAEDDYGGVVVEDVGVSPSTPTPGEDATIQLTITNHADTEVEFSSLAVRTLDPLVEHGRNRNPGSIEPNETATVEVDATFDETGVYDLQLLLSGEVGNEEFTRELEHRLAVRERGPSVVLRADDPVEGAETTVELTVANGEREAVRNVRVRLDGPSFRVDDPIRIEPELDPGEQTTFEYTVVPESVGEQRLTARIDFVEPDDEERTVEDVQFVDVDPIEEDASLTVTTFGDGPRPALRTELINLGNAPLADVVLTVYDGDDDPITQRTAADVPPDGTVTTPINVTGIDAAELTVEASYRTGSIDGTVSDTVSYSTAPGRIELTGVEVEQRPGEVLVRGDASNTGLSDTQGVVVRIPDVEGVDPIQQDLFVGEVPASDFVQFELSAELADDRSTIPLEVEYLVDGDRVTETVDVDAADATLQQTAGDGGFDDDGSGGFGIGAALLALLALAVVSIAGYGVYRSRQ